MNKSEMLAKLQAHGIKINGDKILVANLAEAIKVLSKDKPDLSEVREEDEEGFYAANITMAGSYLGLKVLSFSGNTFMYPFREEYKVLTVGFVEDWGEDQFTVILSSDQEHVNVNVRIVGSIQFTRWCWALGKKRTNDLLSAIKLSVN